MPMPHPRIAILLVATAATVGGCSVRDERAAGTGDSAWWATAAGQTRQGLIADPPAHATATPAIEYVDGFAAGERRADEAGLPMLVVFRASWCRWSGDLLTAVGANARIVGLARRYVCVSVDADRDAATCERFSVRAFPTVLILDTARVERFRGTGSSAVGPLAAAMTEVLAEPGTPRRIAGGDARSRR